MFPLGMSEQSVRRSCTVGCSNSSAKLQIWKQTQCDLQKLHDQSPSLRPHILHTFPERAQDQCVRQEWIKNINRDDFASKSNCKVGFDQQRLLFHLFNICLSFSFWNVFLWGHWHLVASQWRANSSSPSQSTHHVLDRKWLQSRLKRIAPKW